MEPLRSKQFESVFCEGDPHIVGNRHLREPQEQAYLALREEQRKTDRVWVRGSDETTECNRATILRGSPVRQFRTTSPHFADSLAAGLWATLPPSGKSATNRWRRRRLISWSRTRSGIIRSKWLSRCSAIAIVETEQLPNDRIAQRASQSTPFFSFVGVKQAAFFSIFSNASLHSPRIPNFVCCKELRQI